MSDTNPPFQCTRRRLFAMAAGAAAAAGMRRASAGAGRPLRLGLIGCGRRGMELLGELLARRDELGVEPALVCDAYAPRAEHAADLARCAVARTWRDAVESRSIDAVAVATPDHWHGPMTAAAMEHGKDVYCEWPMALLPGDAAAVRRTAERTGRALQVGVGDAADTRWLDARDVAAGRTLGALQRFQANTGGSRRTPPPLDDVDTGRLDWDAFAGPPPHPGFTPERFLQWQRFRPFSRGAAAELFPTAAAALLACRLAVPARVSATGRYVSALPESVPETILAEAEFAGSETLVLGGTVPGPPRFRFEGGQVALEAEGLRIAPDSDGPAPAVGHGAPRPLDLLRDWVEAIRARRDCLFGPKVAFPASVLVEMAARSVFEVAAMAWAPEPGQVVPAPPRPRLTSV